MSSPRTQLSNVCEITMGQAPDGETYNSEGMGLPLIAGAGDFGTVTPAPTKFTSAPTKISQSGDIILCIRATIGDRNWSDSAYCLGRGVAGLRADSTQLDQRYLWHWIGHAAPELKAKGRGATFLQVSKSDIGSLDIALPPLPEQRRIAAILDKADALRAKRREAIAKLDQLLQSVFLDMFGDPVTNPKGWPVRKLGELGSLDRGVSKHRPRNAPELLGGTHPLIQTGDVARSGGYIRAHTSTYSDAGLAQSKKWPAGTLCITIAANIADTGILTFDACFPDSVVGFKAGAASNAEYVQGLLGFMREILDEKAPQVAQKNINLDILRNLPVPVPPKSMQDEWARFASQTESLKQTASQAASRGERLMLALQSSAFSAQT